MSRQAPYLEVLSGTYLCETLHVILALRNSLLPSQDAWLFLDAGRECCEYDTVCVYCYKL
jgi:hypothetical protein